MAKSSADILKEYLVSIGFQVDEKQVRNFRDNLSTIDKRLEELGKVAIASATALSASVTIIASKLEQMHYASERTRTSVGNLQTFRFAAEQIGVSADDAQAAVEGMARALRLQPGLFGLLQELSINPNQEGVKLLMDLVDRLRRMPFFQAAQYAQMFGIDERTLFMMEKGFEQIKQFEAERRKALEQAGIDPDDAAQKSHRFMLELRELTNRWEILSQVIESRFLPVIGTAIDMLSDLTQLLIQADKETDGWSSRILGLVGSVTGGVAALKLLRGGLGMLGIGGAASGAKAAVGNPWILATVGQAVSSYFSFKKAKEMGAGNKTAAALSAVNPWLLEAFDHFRKHPEQLQGAAVPTPKIPGVASNPAVGAQPAIIDPTTVGSPAGGKDDLKLPENVDALIKRYAAQYGVDVALAEAQAWVESHGKQSAISKKGAIGVYQLMPETARQLGVDPYNLEGNISGGIHYLSDLLKQYGGDTSLALAAYNAGGKRVAQYGGVPPYQETRDYIAEIMADMERFRLGEEAGSKSVTLHQQTEIRIFGSGDSKDAAGQVVKSQTGVNNDLVRNLKGAVE